MHDGKVEETGRKRAESMVGETEGVQGKQEKLHGNGIEFVLQ